MGFITIFYLVFLVPTILSFPSCNTTDNCTCIPGGDLEVRCPNDTFYEYNSTEEYIVVHFKEQYQTTEIDCYNTDIFRMDLLPNISVPEKKRLEMNGCPLPAKSFKQISDHFSMKTLQVMYFGEAKNLTINKECFEGLHLRLLKFADLSFAYVDEDAFSNIPNLYSLEMGNNRNLTLNARAFRNLPKLKVLSLMQNRFEDLPEGLFDTLKNLSTLHLFNNNLRVITDETFSGLSNLSLLELRTNNIENVSERAFQNLKLLSAVNLMENKIRTISANIFKNNQRLQKILMGRNSKLELPDYLFANLPLLRIVDLQQCNLISIAEHIFENSTSLTEINLNRNKLEEIPPRLLEGLRHLEKLDLGRNALKKINGAILRDLVGLKYINLERNEIVYIDHEAFYNMANLNYINLSHNQLSMNFSHILVDNEELEDVDFSYNFITNVYDVIGTENFKPKLKKLDLSHNLITEIKLRDIPFSHDLSINLNHNKISKVGFDSINYISTLITTITLTGNPINCNCDNYELFQFLNKEQKYKEKIEMFNIVSDGVVCQSPQELKDSKLVDVSPIDIVCGINNTSACPLECSCNWRPFDTSVVINCTQKNLTEFPEIDHNELMSLFTFNQTEMHLQGNDLKSGPSENIKGYDNVTKLYLSNNNIRNVDWLPLHLEVLHLDNNQLTTLNPRILNILNKTELTLHTNPWRCDCDALHLGNFLRQYPKHVDVNSVKCHHNKTKLIHNLSETDLCQTKLIFYILLPVLSFVLFIMLLLVLFFRYQQPIKVWLFNQGYLLWWVTEDELDKDKEYDAFISYSHHDENFVIQDLLPVLESGQNPYKLCLHYRNWVAGEFIATQVTNSVLKSRRTLVVLSPNFLESVWGKMEFRTAHTQAMTEGRARVIIVLYGEVNMDILDDELKAYMKTNTYVKWGDPYFWNKLRYALPHSKRKSVKNGQKITNMMSCIDDKLDLVVPVTPSPGTTPPVLSLGDSVLKKSPLDFIPRQETTTPPAEAGLA